MHGGAAGRSPAGAVAAGALHLAALARVVRQSRALPLGLALRHPPPRAVQPRSRANPAPAAGNAPKPAATVVDVVTTPGARSEPPPAPPPSADPSTSSHPTSAPSPHKQSFSPPSPPAVDGLREAPALLEPAESRFGDVLLSAADAPTLETNTPTEETNPVTQVEESRSMRSSTASRVPASRMARLLHYGGLAAGLGWGVAAEAVRRTTAQRPAETAGASLLLSGDNLERLVGKLSKMRGAALKLGQFLSIQDTKQLPPQIEAVLQRVQNSANYMPEWQTERVLAQNLGTDWRSHFSEFDMRPFAAASIGQVHAATLHPDGPFARRYAGVTQVAVKVQFPGVRESITSDIGTLRWLLVASAALPRGLYLDNSLTVLARELDDECDYAREAECGRRMRDLIGASSLAGDFAVPQVIDELCGPMVLTTEMMHGRPLKDVLGNAQETRDWIGTRILQLCMHELFEFRLMQTDPNWSNFLFNEATRKIELIDFGATRDYSDTFMTLYGRLLDAAVDGDREIALQLSRELGYLTGDENEIMLEAHLDSLFALATPFRADAPSPFPFGLLGPGITSKIRAQIPIMLRHRLTPPPSETYSLNRKLSGAFLLCERLNSHVPVHTLWNAVKQARHSED